MRELSVGELEVVTGGSRIQYLIRLGRDTMIARAVEEAATHAYHWAEAAIAEHGGNAIRDQYNSLSPQDQMYYGIGAHIMASGSTSNQEGTQRR